LKYKAHQIKLGVIERIKSIREQQDKNDVGDAVDKAVYTVVLVTSFFHC
jgi:hypothetical protein